MSDKKSRSDRKAASSLYSATLVPSAPAVSHLSLCYCTYCLLRKPRGDTCKKSIHVTTTLCLSGPKTLYSSKTASSRFLIHANQTGGSTRGNFTGWEMGDVLCALRCLFVCKTNCCRVSRSRTVCTSFVRSPPRLAQRMSPRTRLYHAVAAAYLVW